MDNQSPVSSPNFPPQVVQCTGLTQRYESSPTPVLEDINFSLEQGESMAVLGVSGSGKSTLLHLIAGLDDLQQGKVQICGQDIHRLDDSSRCALRNQSIGFVYQFHHLLADFNVLENTLMPLWIGRGYRSKKDIPKAKHLLSQAALSDCLYRYPYQLSGGEKQRVAVCRALVTRPKLLIADEPTGQLDNRNAQEVINRIFELNREISSSIIFVTHNLFFTKYFDKTYHLQDSKLTLRN